MRPTIYSQHTGTSHGHTSTNKIYQSGIDTQSINQKTVKLASNKQGIAKPSVHVNRLAAALAACSLPASSLRAPSRLSVAAACDTRSSASSVQFVAIGCALPCELSHRSVDYLMLLGLQGATCRPACGRTSYPMQAVRSRVAASRLLQSALPACSSSSASSSRPCRNSVQIRAQSSSLAAATTVAPPDLGRFRPPWLSNPKISQYNAETDRTDQLTKAMQDGTVLKPADHDHVNFQLHWSVDFWRDFAVPDTLQSDSASVATKVQLLTQKMRDAGVWKSPQSAAYWTYHVGRSGLLALQGIAGLFAAQGASTAEQAAGGSGQERAGMRFNNVAKWGISPLYEAMVMFYQDYRNIQAGNYKLPWDMTTGGHKQWNPVQALAGVSRFLREATSTLERRNKGTPEDVWLKSPLYPQYYLNTFHYQTDGWLSKESASIYELSTETLFLGRQDAMQRQTLVPLMQHMRGSTPASTPPRILEVACGTGRFATFMKDNLPNAEITCLDLSPYYLAEARSNLSEWSRLRNASKTSPPDQFLQAAAEGIPAPDNTYDAVTCIYLFHELPPSVRREAAAEMARVVRPGGMVVLTDSAQFGDRPPWDANLGGFGSFNEPYYRSFITTDLGKLFKDVGLQPDTKLMGSSSKTLSFVKPRA